MADRPIWRGQLRLALVSCPVALYSVRQPSESLHFHFINPDTGNRVRMVTQDAETDEELSRKSLRRGFEFKKDHYVLLDDDDFDRARIDSSSVLTVEKFVRGDAIDPVYYDSSYYLVPDGTEKNQADDVFVVLRAAIAKTGRTALSRLVIARRERAVALMPLGNGIVVHTLHDMREVAAPDTLFDAIPDGEPDKEMVALAVKLIDRQTGAFDPADMEDRYEARLRDVIDAKLKGEDLSVPEEEAPSDNVVDLMGALRRSLGENASDTGSGKTKKASASDKKKTKSAETTTRADKQTSAKRKRA